MVSRTSLLFWKKKPRPQDAQPTSDTEAQEAVENPAEKKVPYLERHIGLLLLNPNYLKTDVGGSGENYALDIVAVHGITGDAFKTWTHRKGTNSSTRKGKDRNKDDRKDVGQDKGKGNGNDEERNVETNWLRDFLPSSFPGARIFSFGYPADVIWTKGTGNFDSFARSLLEELKRVRVQSKDQSRCIIFICHSMGGIVVKKALTIARLDSEYDEIRNSVSAILFLGTPHRGSAVVPLATIFTRLASVANFPVANLTGQIRTDLVQGLGKDSDPLTEITKNFRNQMANIKIASFIEKEITKPFTTVIVDESSGIMGLPDERIVPMHGCDHKTICRFESETSSGYQSILGVLQGWADVAKEKKDVLTSDDISCLKSLAFLEMNFRRSDADKAHPNTCGWILEHESYRNWLSKQRGLLWIKGKPGAGKSTLLASVYRIFQENKLSQADLSLEFFFHGRGTALQKTSLGMFRSLLHQLYTRDRSVRTPILNAFHDKDVYGEVGKGWDWQLRELKDLFFNTILAAAKSRKIVVFIDALDEAGPDARDLVDYFHEVNDHLNEAKSTAAICISCRHYPVTAVIPGLDVLVEENNHHDISHYVHDKLQTNIQKEEKHSALQEWIEIENRIVENASGVFQWARLVVPMVLEQYEEGDSWEDIRQMLARVPRELGAVYEHILNNIIKPERWKRTLHLMQWIFLAERPLTVDEIRLAMAFDDTYISSALKSYQDLVRFVEPYDRMQKLVNSLSGGLAEVKYHKDEGIVQFIHQSVNDFMLSKGLRFLVSRTYDTIDGGDVRVLENSNNNEIIGRGQDRLTKSCINYLRLADLPWEIANHETRHKFNKTFPFIDYATNYWHIHAEKAEQRGILQEHIARKFEETDQLFRKWTILYDILRMLGAREFAKDVALFHVGSSSNLQSVVLYLLQEGNSIEAQDQAGNRALHYAAREGHKDMVEMLLNAKVNMGAKNDKGVTPMELAAGKGHDDVVRLLLGRGADINNALQAAANAGSVALIKYLLDNNADINACGGTYGTALQAAASVDQKDVVQFLIKHGADVNLQGGRYGTALQAAASRGNHAIVQLLLEQGADVNSQCGEYGNALQAAAQGADLSIVSMLLDSGADVNAQGGKYNTALQAVAQRLSRKDDIVELLLAKGANVHMQGGEYGNALQAACFQGNHALVELLLERGADVNTQGGEYGNALQAAAWGGDAELIELLLEKGAILNAQGGKYGNALQAACARGRPDAVTLLVDKGADVNAQGGIFGNALQAAAGSYGGRIVVGFLIENGADVNAQGGRYKNALTAAATVGYISSITQLLRKGAWFDEEDEEFNKALWEAELKGMVEVIELLGERGFDKDIYSSAYVS